VSRSRLVPLALAVTALLAVVAIVARGQPLGSTGGKGGLPLGFWDYVFTTIVIVGTLVLLALGAALLLARRTRKTGSYFRQSMIQWLAFFALLAIFGVILARRHVLLHLHLPPQPPGHVPTGRASGGRPAPGTRPLQLRWDEIVIVLALVVVATVAGVLSSRRPRRLLRPLRKASDALAAALDESIDDLRADPDLRRAIIAAYARMEAALAAAGVPRRPSEAPLEYLERALLNLDASADSVRTLTNLFEWARFSHHEPEPSMRDDAVDALVAVRDELRASELIPA
jgi:Domain of unknown function (DUF4129)